MRFEEMTWEEIHKITQSMPQAQLLTYKQQLDENPVFWALLHFGEHKVEKMQRAFFQVSMTGAGQEERAYRIKHFEELLTIIKTKLENTGKDNKK